MRSDAIARTRRKCIQQPDHSASLGDSVTPSTETRFFGTHKDEEPAIIVGKSDATMQPASQNNQLMPKHRVLSSNLIFDWSGAARTKHTSPVIPPA
jgi:hypothetical protein